MVQRAEVSLTRKAEARDRAVEVNTAQLPRLLTRHSISSICEFVCRAGNIVVIYCPRAHYIVSLQMVAFAAMNVVSVTFIKQTEQQLHANDPPRANQVEMTQAGFGWEAALNKLRGTGGAAGSGTAAVRSPSAGSGRCGGGGRGKGQEKGKVAPKAKAVTKAAPARARSADAKLGKLPAAPCETQEDKLKAGKRAQDRFNTGLPDMSMAPCPHLYKNGSCKHGGAFCSEGRHISIEQYHTQVKGFLHNQHRDFISAGFLEAPPAPKK